MENIKNILKVRGICLSPFGVNNIALTRSDTLYIIDLLKEKGIAIKGGDIWKKNKEEMILTYDNWYTEKKDDETDIEFINRSIIETKLYISNDRYNRDDIYIELVI